MCVNKYVVQQKYCLLFLRVMNENWELFVLIFCEICLPLLYSLLMFIIVIIILIYK